MTFDIINNNLILVFRENISSFFKTDEVEETLSQIYADQNPTPIINKIPPNVTIFIPQAQVGILISNKTVIVSDQMIGNFAKKDVVNFTKLTTKIKNETKKANIAYGYNYIYQVSGENFLTLCNLVKKNLLGIETELTVNSDTITYMLPTFSINKGSYKISIKANPVIEGHEGIEADRIIIEANVHFNAELPELSVLTTEYREKHEEVFQIVNSIFKV